MSGTRSVRTVKSTPRPWTPEEDAAAEAMIAEGKTMLEIGMALGRSRVAVCHRTFSWRTRAAKAVRDAKDAAISPIPDGCKSAMVPTSWVLAHSAAAESPIFDARRAAGLTLEATSRVFRDSKGIYGTIRWAAANHPPVILPIDLKLGEAA